MSISARVKKIFIDRLKQGAHKDNDYFSVIREFVDFRKSEGSDWQQYIDTLYSMLLGEIVGNTRPPQTVVKFGTSGWRGILGKDIHCQSVSAVTEAIVELYTTLDTAQELTPFLGVETLEEAQERGCVVGFDNRFGGEMLAITVVGVLTSAGFNVHYAGESTTGVLSASVMEIGAAFSVNLTPSHNPLEYGGYKYNAADAGPAASELTSIITTNARRIITEGFAPITAIEKKTSHPLKGDTVQVFDSLEVWKDLVRKNRTIHGLDYDNIIENFKKRKDCAVVIDSVHGASRLHVSRLFDDIDSPRLVHLRGEEDVTFGGVAPEPSSKNMQGVVEALASRQEEFKIGAIIDPDGDRIRFTDGLIEISMNQFGAMAYHFLHEVKGKKGMVAKTVATSNFANCLAEAFKEEIYEPKVGFKEFKPVIGKALVYFEESDGISIIGHTPEKDAYIGLLLAVDMVLSQKKNLGDYLHEIEAQYGSYYPDRDGIIVSLQGEELLQALSGLEKYVKGEKINVGGQEKEIVQVIDIDGRKMILEDGSWLMIRPSGTEPKVRFYVESRTNDGTVQLVQTANNMLGEIGLL